MTDMAPPDRPKSHDAALERERAYVALLAHSLEIVVDGRFGIGSERHINVDQWRHQAQRLLDSPEVAAMRAEFYDRKLADVREELEASYAAS